MSDFIKLIMRIGIVTFWQGKDNYGQILQLWAMQYWLKKWDIILS